MIKIALLMEQVLSAALDMENSRRLWLKQIGLGSAGIGLANVKRRLELLYYNRHHFTINKTDNWFTASLELTLK